jgi:hypothetical protein
MKTRTLDPSVFALYALLCLPVLGATAAALHFWSHPLPYFDQWGEMIWGERENLTLAKLWAVHNEHRIFFPRLLFAVDQSIFSGSGFFLVATTIFFQTCHALLFGFTLRNRPIGGPWKDSRLGWLFLCLTFVCLLSPLQFENFHWSFQVQFALVYLAGTGAVVCLVQSHVCRRLSSRLAWGLFTLFWASIATGSMSNGILIWPVLLILAILGRFRWPSLLLLVVFGGLALTFFFQGYDIPGHAQSGFSPSHTPDAIRFALRFIGLPFAFGSPLVAEIAGAAGWLLLLAGAGVLALKAKTFQSLLPFLGIAGFVVASSLLTAYGRIITEGLGGAFANRYMTPALIFWAAVITGLAVALWKPATERSTARSRKLATLSLGLPWIILLVLLVRQPEFLKAWQATWVQKETAALALYAKVNDPESFARIFPIVEWVDDFSRQMEGRELGHFRPDEWDAFLGMNFDPSAQDVLEREGWTLTESRLTAPSRFLSAGIRLNGTSPLRPGSSFQRFAVVDREGAVRGYGSVFPNGQWVAFYGFPIERPSAEVVDVAWDAGSSVLVISLRF